MKPNTDKSKSFGIAAVPARARAKPMVLIAEDSGDSREILKMLLGSKGYDVVAAANGLQAVEVALTKFPDLIFLDMELPLLDGLAVTRNLRCHAKFQKVPIILVSGHDPTEYREPALAAGCTDYLPKPIDFDRFDAILNSAVPLRRGIENELSDSKN